MTGYFNDDKVEKVDVLKNRIEIILKIRKQTYSGMVYKDREYATGAMVFKI